MACLISTDFPSVARQEASVLQLAAPHRRQRVWTRIFKFLTRTIRSPAVAPLARFRLLRGLSNALKLRAMVAVVPKHKANVRLQVPHRQVLNTDVRAV